MRNTLAIAGKELRIYFSTWTAWVVLVAFFGITAFFFAALVEQFQDTRLRYAEANAAALLGTMNLTDLVVGPLFSYVATFFIFMLPILTMRLLAEERRTRTLELLLTTPVRPIEIVLGKYAAALVVMLSMLALTVVFPLVLETLGDGPDAVDWRTVAAGYLGMALLGAGALAVALFASAVTESQAIAAALGFAALLALLVIGVAAEGAGGGWHTLFTHLSLSNHLHPFARGLVRSVDVVYYLSLAFTGVFLTWRVVEVEQWR
jgi:ABC-2 type transport system permease protein